MLTSIVENCVSVYRLMDDACTDCFLTNKHDSTVDDFELVGAATAALMHTRR